jgi:uncharacterized protein (TIGR00730 family)
MQETVQEVRQRLQTLLEEYLEVEAELQKLEDTEFRVCIFGSARIRQQDPTYQEVYRLARALAVTGMDIVTGGGPGLMEAANRGVQDAQNGRSKSYGLPILLPRVPEDANKHLDIKSEHKRFSSRLDEFMRLSHAVVVAPGGIGTLLELAYVWQLLQVGLLPKRPVILLGGAFWGGLVEWMRDQQLGRGFVSRHDFDSIQIVDSTEEAVAMLRAEQHRFEQTHPQAAPTPPAEGMLPTTNGTAAQVLHTLESPQTLNGARGRKNGRRRR